MPKKPKVLIIGTGGAISAKPVNGVWKYGEIPIEELIENITGINSEFEVNTTNLFRMDSADLKPENWLTLANTIYYKMKDYDGIVVTMGTDTMAYAATAISFLIQNSNIPIVFTGSLINPIQISSDARRNLKEAITVAGKSDITGTSIVFDGKIMHAGKAKKINASEFAAFTSFGDEIGRIEQIIENAAKKRRRRKSKPVLYTVLDTFVATLKVYPGFDGNRIRQLVDYYGAKGIVLEGYGLGNIPIAENTVHDAIKYAATKNVAIVIASNVPLGKYWRGFYEAEIGNRLKGLAVIPVYDMLPETAYVKLMWTLAQTREFEKVKEIMQTAYCGEISEFKLKRK